MVDTWNWLLGVLVPPLIHDAINTLGRRVDQAEFHDQKVSTLKSQIETLRSLSPSTYDQRTLKHNGQIQPDLEIRINLTAKRVTVGADASLDYPVEVEAISTESCFNDQLNETNDPE